MKENYLLKKSGVVGIIVLFICASFVSSIGGYSEETTQVDIDIEDVCESQENVLVTCSTFGFPGEPSQEITMSLSEAEFLYDKIKELQIEVARDPLSDKTQQLQHEIITLADEHNLLPAGLSVETIKSRLTPTLRPQHPRITLPRLQNRASELFCNYVSTGSGTSFPIIILPRLIPILLTPIPRLFVRWSTLEGMTSCGGLRSGTGFIAYGAQNGIALGFWGIGFSIFLPPVMAYGLFGYALYASVNAEEIEWWPPNNPPVISNENPPSGTWNVPVSLSELSFQIEDADGDPMSYSVTTSPDIGSGSGTNKGDGVYTVPVSGLKPNTQYQWVVEVADGRDVTMKELSFMTEELPFDPFDEGWQHRKKITIDHTQVAGDLSYFPVLVSTLDSDLQVKAQDDGDDILFMDGVGVANKLYHEIEYYDDSTGELVAWLNIHSVSHDEDTALYMYYGNPTASNQESPTRIWDTGFTHVWHMDGTDDSTSNNYDLTNYGASTTSSGKIGTAYDFEKSETDYLTYGDNTISHPKPMCMELWFSMESTATEDYYGMMSMRDQYAVDLAQRKNAYTTVPDNCIFGLYKDISSGWNFYDTGVNSISTTTWYHIAFTIDNSGNAQIFLDGVVKESGSGLSDATSPDWESGIGAYFSSSISHHFDGIIDEVRISDVTRSAEWVSTSYNNQNDPSVFLNFGPEETGS